MSIYITNTYVLGGIASKAQNLVTEEAKKLGIEEIRIPYIDYESEDRNNMSNKIDGILTGITSGDTIIYQSPTWNDPNFDIFFMNKLLGIGNLNIIIFIHDIRPMMFLTEQINMPSYIELFNVANYLIVPSKNMAQYLGEKGVTTPMVTQYLWDSNKEMVFQEVPKLKKQINFIDSDAKFMISRNFPINSDVTLDLYGRKNNEMVRAENINYHGFFNEYNLLHELHKGGFGLVWTEDMYWREYMKYNTSFKTSTYLRAGIPLIVHESISCRKMIEDNHWGIIVNSLAEAVEKVKAMTVEEYNSYVKAIQEVKYSLENGYFTKKVLVDSVYKLFVQ
ncbi:nucleotide sugar synthetase [Ligilactobacillus salivarius]|uniref:Glucosyltransferase 3 n=1 Tax=Ligilactobacillus salivarius TaxID=1624 RepID=A0A9X6S4C7_9LACO|nr:nucleotide sugar synthetase [Ligilactobacillus salivarius]OTF89262.1 nucleotide sugar synthetase [Ligilactobacillus salivarius]PAY26409.1 nucleotide sugar synthetase [Ligilactobacillus salivarius]PAY29096.1 nucleotide sugar synthetase [Ligilactobacillus salivarius]PAY30215.1 nucleotide sugar synthetase [Ligilactobacillus salivarius]PAY35073.1 nucleotide sugar synthetase [Ligilactobacillus salivarius]